MDINGIYTCHLYISETHHIIRYIHHNTSSTWILIHVYTYHLHISITYNQTRHIDDKSSIYDTHHYMLCVVFTIHCCIYFKCIDTLINLYFYVNILYFYLKLNV
jgi:hypothetical protein